MMGSTEFILNPLEKDIDRNALLSPQTKWTHDSTALFWNRAFSLFYGKLISEDPEEFEGVPVYSIDCSYNRQLHSLYLATLTTYNRCGTLDSSNYVSIVRPKFLANLEKKLGLSGGSWYILPATE